MGQRQFLYVSAAMLIFASRVVAASNGHLEPEMSVFGNGGWDAYYETVVTTVLKDAFTNDVVARVIIIPSFSRETAIGISRNDEHYSIFALEPEHHLYGYEILREKESGEEVVMKDGKETRDEEGIAGLRNSLHADWHDEKVTRCHADIDPALGKAITAAWRLSLLTTHFDDNEPTLDKNGNVSSVAIKLDGTVYHFADAYMAAQAWSPDAGSAPAELVAIADTMADYCKTKNKDDLKTLSARAEALVKELKDAFADP